ncbi:dynamin GTPase, putative [Trichophyton verrucosum HKI 0517]|uniref:Dynamin GTPase, putative n=1 Tax=Trichophyton verrucosum (strain HKI 0517) TaxID=663202 RepID=D4CZJ2_TRIVH|nr:dynamin GTPase, putative [Trichophyton verrucosum HKI 0517]EFE44983.1 dynamin GTPase, putative [Trichophyton verrucosum HKI 0517]
MIESASIKSKLNLIDKARARGAGNHISLPQLVVCGDQSAGKSSVLEGITEIPFPRKDGLCTRFATEIVLRHFTGVETITATIIPHSSRDEATIIEAVGALMGLRGFVDQKDAPPFGLDVLRIEVVGETGLHLTIVDLPGLVSGAEGDDRSVVESLVNSYLENPRTIILAVVPATSDVETQPIIRAARQFDNEGTRTVGIVTKVDLINDGTEERIVAVAKNQGPIKLKLGYYLLKNPSPKEIEFGITAEERKKKELSWFQKPGWKICSEITKLLEDAQKEVTELGEERPNAQAQRLFLSKLSMQFQGLVQAATGGTYQGVYSQFFNLKANNVLVNRVRSRAHELNSTFARNEDNVDTAFPLEWGNPETLIDGVDTWILTVSMQLYAHAAFLFALNSHAHTKRVHKLISTFVEQALCHILIEDRARNELWRSIKASLQKNLAAALAELHNICEDEKMPPITYNHSYADNVEKARQKGTKNAIQSALKKAKGSLGSTWGQDYDEREHHRRQVQEALEEEVIFDMERRACEEAKTALDAYYKVAMKTFVDNVCRQVIERHLMSKLPTIFSPTSVLEMTDLEITRIAGEPADRTRRRNELMGMIQTLGESLEDLQN